MSSVICYYYRVCDWNSSICRTGMRWLFVRSLKWSITTQSQRIRRATIGMSFFRSVSRSSFALHQHMAYLPVIMMVHKRLSLIRLISTNDYKTYFFYKSSISIWGQIFYFPPQAKQNNWKAYFQELNDQVQYISSAYHSVIKI